MSIQYNEIEEYLFQILDSVVHKKTAIYVAGPLESGKEFYNLTASGEYVLGLIRPKNQNKLSNFAQSLRQNLNQPVIDPGILKIPGWAGSDYGTFFIKIIENYAKEVWFMDEWEFSGGATKEFKFCATNGICCRDERGERLTAIAGNLLIKKAILYVEDLNLDSSRLKSRLLF